MKVNIHSGFVHEPDSWLLSQTSSGFKSFYPPFRLVFSVSFLPGCIVCDKSQVLFVLPESRMRVLQLIQRQGRIELRFPVEGLVACRLLVGI